LRQAAPFTPRPEASACGHAGARGFYRRNDQNSEAVVRRHGRGRSRRLVNGPCRSDRFAALLATIGAQPQL